MPKPVFITGLVLLHPPNLLPCFLFRTGFFSVATEPARMEARRRPEAREDEGISRAACVSGASAAHIRAAGPAAPRARFLLSLIATQPRVLHDILCVCARGARRAPRGVEIVLLM